MKHPLRFPVTLLMFSGKNAFLIAFGMIGLGRLTAQNPGFSDTIQSATGNPQPIDARFEVPMGQFFIPSPSPVAGVSTLNTFGASVFLPQKRSATYQNRRFVSFSPGGGFMGRTQASAAANSGEVVYSYRLLESAEGDPADMLWEFYPDANQAYRIHVQKGVGDLRLNLSGLSVAGLDISSGNSNIVISYSAPNKVEMDQLFISGGMGKIVIRNLEMARAKNVDIRNGLGETQIILGNACSGKKTVRVEVGAGKCMVVLDPDVPVKIVLSQGLFGAVNVPPDFEEAKPHEYVNAAFRKDPTQGITFVVDLGVGNFTIIPSGQ